MTEADRLTFTASRFKLGMIAVLCFLVMLVGLWVIGESDDPIMIGWSWVGVIVLGVGVVLGLWQVRKPGRLELTPEGFEVTGVFGTGLIPWSDVEAFFVHSEPESEKGHGAVQPHAAWRLTHHSESRDTLVSQISRAGLAGEVDGTIPRMLGGAPEGLVDLLESWRVRYS